MFGQRRRRWANIKPPLGECKVRHIQILYFDMTMKRVRELHYDVTYVSCNSFYCESHSEPARAQWGGGGGLRPPITTGGRIHSYPIRTNQTIYHVADQEVRWIISGENKLIISTVPKVTLTCSACFSPISQLILN